MNRNYIINQIKESINTKERLLKDDSIVETINNVSKKCIEVFKNKGKIILAGNGGSASESNHFSAELVGRLNYDRGSLPSISLNSNNSIITCISNDYGYDYIFSRQIESLGNINDFFIGITTSGNSSNIIKALKICKKKGIKTLVFNGKDGGIIEKEKLYDYNITVPSMDTKYIQETHMLLTHILCSIIEKEIFPK